MILASSVYQDIIDNLNVETNGQFSIPMFNRYSRRAELSIIDWITGSILGNQPPEPYLTQKNKDILAPFIKKFPTHAVGGRISRPADYYGYENMFGMGNYQTTTECDDEDDDTQQSQCNTPIVLLDGAQFNVRCRTYIEGQEPSFKEPIVKEIGKEFEFEPKDIGSVTLEYYRYPVFANIVPKIDPQYNDEVPDEALTTNYEWDEKARPLLIWFITDMFANRTSNQSMKQFNQATSKTAHG